MEDDKYICWGDDKEDLTKKVQEAIAIGCNAPDYSAVLGYKIATKGKKAKKRRWRVIVKCNEGHENAFEGEYWPRREGRTDL
jgi:hypothetical protein